MKTRRLSLGGNKGFTLLELLVVIGIISILVAIGTVSYSSVQQKGRDVKRRGDIDSISRSLEQYFADNGSSYPTLDSCGGYESYITGEVPEDPKTGEAYVQSGTCAADGSSYCVCAFLEGEGNGNAFDGSCSFTDPGTGGTRDYYCLVNTQ